MALSLERSRTFPASVDAAFAFTLPVPLEQLFCRRFGPLPAISSTDQAGGWATAGQRRTVHTSDGGSMREELVSVGRPNRFTYRLTEFRGPLRGLASSIDGAWTFDPVLTGCRITWSWTIQPTSTVIGKVLPVLGPFWRTYASRALDHLEELMVQSGP